MNMLLVYLWNGIMYVFMRFRHLFIIKLDFLIIILENTFPIDFNASSSCPAYGHDDADVSVYYVVMSARSPSPHFRQSTQNKKTKTT